MKMYAFVYYSLPTQRQFEDACDDFAELLSRGLSLNDAARVMCMSVGTGCVLFAAICAPLGWQAA